MKKALYTITLCLFSHLLFAQVATLVKQVDISASFMYNVNGKMVFYGDSSGFGPQVWVSDGTEAGTKNITYGDMGPVLVFGNVELWKTYYPSIFNNNLYFLGVNKANGREIWKTDGTHAGTALLKDIWPGSGGFNDGNHDHGPNFCVANNTLYFAANDGQHGYELWKTDGTESGTVMVKNISSDENLGSSPGNLVAFKNKLYFSAGDTAGGYAVQIYTSDGTDAGTKIFHIPTATTHGSMSSGGGFASLNAHFNVSGNNLFFTALKDNSGYAYLYGTDGTEQGTLLLDDSAVGISEFAVVNGSLYYYSNYGAHNPSNLFKSDGTKNGTGPVVTNDVVAVPLGSEDGVSFFSFNNKLYFYGSNTDKTQFGLCVSDGTTAGTYMYEQLPVVDGNHYGSAYGFLDAGSSFFCHAQFLVNPTTTGLYLYQSNGTSAGNKVVWGPSAIAGGSIFYNGSVYFTGEDSLDTQNNIWLYKFTPAVLPTTGIDNVTTSGTQVSVSPIPFTTQTEFRFAHATNADMNLSLYDVTGRKVQTTFIHKGLLNTIINREGLPNGIYFYQLTSGSNIIGSGKIIAE